MELRQLRYFIVVAEELNFGRDAERLLITGPSLSQQIKALEHDLGVRLFDRDRRSVALTPAGAALLPRTRALLDRADDLQRRAARVAEGSLDLEQYGLSARLIGTDRLHAVAAGDDTTSWASWNLYAGQLARAAVLAAVHGPHRRGRRPRNPPAGRLAARQRPAQAVAIPHLGKPVRGCAYLQGAST